jgi:hypothetical protein
MRPFASASIPFRLLKTRPGRADCRCDRRVSFRIVTSAGSNSMSIQSAIQKKPKPERTSVKLAGAFVLGAVISAIISPIVTNRYAQRSGEAAESTPMNAKMPRGPRRVDHRPLYARVYGEGYDRFIIKPTMFVQHLKDIINAKGTTEELLPPAQSFVRVMQQRRSPLLALSATVGHEMDDLEHALDALEKNPQDRSLQDRLRKSVLGLAATWQNQFAAVDASLKQTMAELGVERILKAVDGGSD